MNKGIVLEKLETHVLVLTPEGEFKKVKFDSSKTEIVEEIIFSSPAHGLAKYIAIAAAILMLIILPLSVFEVQDSRVIACITVDINPSVELGINDGLKVNRAIALNSEGTKLIEKVSLKNRSIDEAIKMLVDAAIDEGYIAKDKENDVLVTAVMLDGAGEKSPEIIKTAEKAKDRIDKTEYRINYEVVETGKQTLEKAKEMGISAGKYMIYLEAKKQGLELDPEELKKNGIDKVLKAKGVSPNELIRNMKQKGKKQVETPPVINDKIDKKTGADQKDESERKVQKETGEDNKGRTGNDGIANGINVKSPQKDVEGYKPGKGRPIGNADGHDNTGSVTEDMSEKTQNMPGNITNSQNRNKEITGDDHDSQNPSSFKPGLAPGKGNGDKRNEDKKAGKRDKKP